MTRVTLGEMLRLGLERIEREVESGYIFKKWLIETLFCTIQRPDKLTRGTHLHFGTVPEWIDANTPFEQLEQWTQEVAQEEDVQLKLTRKKQTCACTCDYTCNNCGIHCYLIVP